MRTDPAVAASVGAAPRDGERWWRTTWPIGRRELAVLAVAFALVVGGFTLVGIVLTTYLVGRPRPDVVAGVLLGLVTLVICTRVVGRPPATAPSTDEPSVPRLDRCTGHAVGATVVPPPAPERGAGGGRWVVASGPGRVAVAWMAAVSHADTLSEILVADDPRDGLWHLVDSGEADEWLPELPALRLEQDPIHRHKDVLSHTISVTAQAPPRLRVRLAALFHDVGKPHTRRFENDNVTFHHHEVVGAKMTRRRMPKLGYDDGLTGDVSRLVELSGRFKGYAEGWSDSAVRRYCRDAGPLLGDLNDLVRSDCTSRNPRRVAELHAALDDLEDRIAHLAREDARRAERPEIDGDAVMQHLGIGPGPAVGEALRFLLDLKRSEGELGTTEVLRRLDAWWAERAVD